MGLSIEDIEAICALLGAPGTGAETLAKLRASFPGLPVTLADASDLDTETPFRRYDRYDLFLVDGSQHCWRLTGELEQASGLVVAARRVPS
jgi:hypothetical protein